MGGELVDGFAGQADDQVQVQVGGGLFFEKAQVLPDPLQVEPPVDARRGGRVQGLDADLELQGTGRETGEPLPEQRREMVRDHLEMDVKGLGSGEEEVEDAGRGREAAVEGAVHELEGARPALPERVQLGQEGLQGKGPDPVVDGTQAERAAERAAARGLDVDEPVGQVLVGVERVGCGERIDLGRCGRDDPLRRRPAREQSPAQLAEGGFALALDEVVGLVEGDAQGQVTDLGATEDDTHRGRHPLEQTDQAAHLGRVPDVHADADDGRLVGEDALGHVGHPVGQAELLDPGLCAQLAQVGVQPAQAEARVDVAGVDGGEDNGGHGLFSGRFGGTGAAKIRPPLFGGRRQGHLAVFVRTSYSKPLFRRTRRTLPKESAMTKTYAEINEKIASGKAVVLTAEEVIDYVDRRGLEAAAREVDVVTTATFGPMCSSGCFLNFGHSKPKMRISEAWINDVLAYSGIAAVDVYMGATQLRHNDPANMYHPGEFRYGGGHVIEDLVAGRKLQLFGLSYGTDDYPRREIRTMFDINDLNQAIMVNPRNCYQNYNVAVNVSDKRIYTYLGILRARMRNMTYCSAGQLAPLLNDPLYETIGVGTSVWLAGARGIVYAQGTQHCSLVERTDNGVPIEGAGTLALTANMKEMLPEFVRGVSFKGYGVSLALGVGVPIPILNPDILRRTTVRDRDIQASVIDYSADYPQKTGKVLARFNYEQLRSGEVELLGKKVPVTSLSSYHKALEICNLLKAEIEAGRFLLSEPSQRLPLEQGMQSLNITGPAR